MVGYDTGLMTDNEIAVLAQHTDMMCELFSDQLTYDVMVYLKCEPEEVSYNTQ